MSILLLAHNTPDAIVDAARRHGFRVELIPSMPGMPAPVASHPDMLLFAGLNKLFVRAAHMECDAFSRAVKNILDEARSLELSLTSDEPSDTYPRDVAFNCAVIGGALVGRADCISPAIKRAASEHMLPTLNVSQGYTKCSTLILGSSARSPIVTADKCIHNLATERGVTSYLIQPDKIELPGYDTGFIGGASFYADGRVYFLGSIAGMKWRSAVEDAISAHGLEIVELSCRPLFDAGCLFIE